MAAAKTTLVFLVCVLAGVSHGEEAACSMKQTDVFSKLIACVTKSHPEYYLVILTKVNDLQSMEKPDFMCSEQNMMTDLSECLLEYIQGCLPASVASQVDQVMPNRDTIRQGIKFLCDHRKDFDDACVTGRLPRVGECITSKMQTFSRVTRSTTTPQSHMHNALCYALQQEEQCLDQSLAGCPQDKVSNIKRALVTFFPSKSCLQSLIKPQVLQFQSEGGRRH